MGSKNKIIAPALPKRFQILGNEWKIEYCDNLYTQHGAWGMTDFNQNLVQIQRPNGTVSTPQDHVMSTLCHEIFHVILHSMSYHDANKDEDFVDRVGASAWQILKTIK